MGTCPKIRSHLGCIFATIQNFHGGRANSEIEQEGPSGKPEHEDQECEHESASWTMITTWRARSRKSASLLSGNRDCLHFRSHQGCLFMEFRGGEARRGRDGLYKKLLWWDGGRIFQGVPCVPIMGTCPKIRPPFCHTFLRARKNRPHNFAGSERGHMTLRIMTRFIFMILGNSRRSHP